MKNTVPSPIKLRKPYQKPQLQCVRLTPEEAVLAGCKISGFPGPGTGGGCEPVLPCEALTS